MLDVRKRDEWRRKVAARRIKGFGWVPDLPDGRDMLYAAPPRPLAELPARTDLRKQCPPVYDQGELGSCTANAISAALEFNQMKQKARKPFTPSRLFIYYNERAIEGTIDSDSGAMLRDGIKTVAKDGACRETTWPYEVDQSDRHRPVALDTREGAVHAIALRPPFVLDDDRARHRIHVPVLPRVVGQPPHQRTIERRNGDRILDPRTESGARNSSVGCFSDGRIAHQM